MSVFSTVCTNNHCRICLADGDARFASLLSVDAFVVCTQKHVLYAANKDAGVKAIGTGESGCNLLCLICGDREACRRCPWVAVETVDGRLQ